MKYSKEMIQALLGDATKELNASDPYECFAFIFLLNFTCSNCGKGLDLSGLGSDVGSIEWCRQAASYAKRMHWQLAPVLSNGEVDLTIYCADCAKASAACP